MNALSLVPANKLEKDPRNLAYLFPTMPVSRYKKATEEYYHLITIRSIESVAKMNGQLLVPASCLHWERKKRYQDQNVRIFGKSYYVIHQDELTDIEFVKYKELTEVY